MLDKTDRKINRLTAGQLKTLLNKIPSDAIICCYSDSEGNQKSTALDVFTEVVGEKVVEEYYGTKYEFTGGDDVMGIDVEEDKGKTVVYIQPSL